MSSPKTAIFILVVLYLVGIGGMLSPYQHLFITLTPVNLLITLGLLLFWQEPKTYPFYARMYGVMLAGFVIEVIGVNTGFPFGIYEYGVAFGPRILGTPPLIGINWFILVYGALVWIKEWGLSKGMTAILTGIAVTALDLIMEPVAIALEFWTWEADVVPWQNYLSWSVIGALMAYALLSINLPRDLKVAKVVFVLQVVFFLTLLILL